MGGLGMGDGRWGMGDWEIGGWEMGDGRWEMGDGRLGDWRMGDGGWEMGDWGIGGWGDIDVDGMGDGGRFFPSFSLITFSFYGGIGKN